MSLGQYLAIGKSVENVSGDGKFNITEPLPLPMLTAPRLPAVKKNGVGAGSMIQHGLPGTDVPDQESAISSRPALEDTVKSQPAERTAKGGRWTLGRRKAGKSAISPAQRELALGQVRPVKNDLTDTDLEVVPAGMPASAAARVGACKTMPSRKPFWRKWLQEMFGWPKG